MRQLRILLAAIAVSAVVAGAVSAQNLVVNGDFETPVVATSQNWNIYDSGTVGLGWTVAWLAPDGTAPNPAHLELHRGVNGWLPFDGSQHAELDTDYDGPGGGRNGEPASVAIYQDLATCPGGTYDVQYAWSPRPNHGNNSLEVYWDGQLVASHSGSGGSNTIWTPELHNLTASGTTTRLEFRETGTPDSLGMFLDGVSVVEVSCGACVVDITDGTPDGCVTLFAGQNIDAGDVCAAVNGDFLEITYATLGGWELVEAHLWVGGDLSEMPRTRKGNPIPGQFPYPSGDISGATTYTFSIPLASLDFACPQEDATYWVAAHAAVRKDNGDGTYQTETGWGDGDRLVDKGNWATVYQIVLSCECNGGGGEVSCETAFAYAEAPTGTCFLSIDEDGDGSYDFNRWGWTIGALGPGTYSYDIYAAAGQCDLGNGTRVGTLAVDYDGSTAVVTVTLDQSDPVTGLPYTMDVTHLYVGNEILPRNPDGEFTVAPGQYLVNSADIGGADTYTFTVSGLSGDVYVVSHSEVCGFPVR